MGELERPKKYTKQQIILLYSCVFIWATASTIIASIIFGILPNHFFIYVLLMTSVWAFSRKLCQTIVSKKIFPDNPDPTQEYEQFDEYQYTSRASSDHYNGITSHRN